MTATNGPPPALAVDHELHMLISRSSGSDRLAEEIGKYRNLVMAVGDAVGNKLQAHEQNMAEHTEVINELLEHHTEEAAAAMGKHIDRGAATAVAALGLKDKQPEANHLTIVHSLRAKVATS